MKAIINILRNRHFWPLFIVIVFAVLAGRSLIFQSGYFNMHDDLQMMRQLEMEKCFLDGQIPCRWVPDMGYGFGFPLFNFYPPLPYLMGQGIRLIGYSFVTTAKLMFALSFIVSGITMYLLAKDFFGRLGGVLSGVFYIWAPYYAVDVYVRGAMNEVWALAWFPLIFWAGYRLIISKKREGIRWIILLALAYFALFTSHNLMVLIFTPFFGMWILLHLWRENKWSRIPQLLISMVWALGLAAFFTLPALAE
ncbi:MAG: 6-pyruvoyl-tetrahydropterin synthase-related protein, partial [Patescibacteria group bacterium]